MTQWQPVKIAYDVIEPSSNCNTDSTPIILLHGMTSSKENWNQISQPLGNATGRKIYNLDARNHGDSEWNDMIDYETMAKDVSHFMDLHSIPKAIIIGHSMGGKIAMALALMESEKVEKLVIEDISPKIVKPITRRFPYIYLQQMKKSLQAIPPEADDETAQKALKQFLVDNTPKGHVAPRYLMADTFMLPIRKTNKGYEWKANVEGIERAFFSSEMNPRNILKGRHDGKILIIYGTKSPYDVISDKDFILEMFPQAELHAIENATHLVHLEFPEEFTGKVIEFLKES